MLKIEKIMENYWEFFKKIAPLPRHINSPSYDEALSAISNRYDIEVIRFGEAADHNGWEIPSKYSVKTAYIKKNGKIIYDGTAHPLGVISYSTSFRGMVTKDELVKHCHYDRRNDDWVPYHFRQSYRPWDRDWGFCIPKKIIDQFQDGEYEVLIEVEEGERELRIGRKLLKGKSNINFAFCAHLDHPGLSNDDLSGVMALCEALERFSEKTELNYGIEIFIVPEIIGPQYYFNDHSNSIPYEGVFVESIGQQGNFYLQKSLSKSRIISKVIKNTFTNKKIKFKEAEFREIYGNDEISFESFGCPMVALNRGKFEGYHSNIDSYDRLNLRDVEECIDIIQDVMYRVQEEIIIVKNYTGIVSCANPKYNLYIDPGEIAFGTENSTALRSVMDFMSLPQKCFSLTEITESCQVSSEIVIEYLRKWRAVNLIEIWGDTHV